MFHTCVVCLWGLPLCLCLSLTRHQNKLFTELSLTRLNRAHLGCDDTSGAPPPQPLPDSPCLALPAITVQELTDACQVGHGTTQTHRHTHKHSAVLVLANVTHNRLCVTCASMFFFYFVFFAYGVIGLEVCFLIVQTKMYIDFKIKEKLCLMGLLTDNNSNTFDRMND